jgi:8-oxo-dGTP diphosphatase
MKEFPCSIDPVIFTLIEDKLHVLLITRKLEPFIGQLALPGGIMIESDRSLKGAAKRVLELKTGIKVNYVEQLGTYGGENEEGLIRDPRGFGVSIAYLALVSSEVKLIKNEESVSEIGWFDVEKLNDLELAFDHLNIIGEALIRFKNKANYSSLPIYLMPEKFTLPQLQKAYEVILGKKRDKSAFRERILTADIIEKVGEKLKAGPYRDAELYQKTDKLIHIFDSNLERKHKM